MFKQVNSSIQDYVAAPSPLSILKEHQFDHILGPTENSQSKCLQLPLVQVQKALNPKSTNEKICSDCSLFQPPIFARRMLRDHNLFDRP